MRSMIVSLTVGFTLVASLACAQATAAKKLAWDQPAATPAEAQSFTYKGYSDGSSTGTPVTTPVCTGVASPFACVIPFPAYTPGSHTVALTAGNVAGESLPSTPLAFTFVVVPGSPSNLRIVEYLDQLRRKQYRS